MIYLDFDGTMVDLWNRFYRVFVDANEITNITFELYKKYKLQYKKDMLVAQKLCVELKDDYFSRKKVWLEEKEYLLLDSLIISPQKIQELKRYNPLILTKRRNEINLKKQLDWLKIDYEFCVIDDSISKYEWIIGNYPKEESIIIGDSLMDLEVGKIECVTPYMVGTGLISRKDFDQMGIKYKYFDDINCINF